MATTIACRFLCPDWGRSISFKLLAYTFAVAMCAVSAGLLIGIGGVVLGVRLLQTLIYPLLAPGNAIKHVYNRFKPSNTDVAGGLHSGHVAALIMFVYIASVYFFLIVFAAPMLVGVVTALGGASAVASLTTVCHFINALPVFSQLGAYFAPIITHLLALLSVASAPTAVTQAVAAVASVGAVSSIANTLFATAKPQKVFINTVKLIGSEKPLPNVSFNPGKASLQKADLPWLQERGWGFR